mgnify:CR=1 FL=1
MNEEIKNTFSEYLGPEFQTKLMWQLLVEPEFAEKVLDRLAIEYFDDDNMKRLFIVMLEYWKEHDKPPNLQNKSIHQAVHTYRVPGSEVDEEMLTAVVDRIRIWNERVINKNIQNDGDIVQKETNMFIKQQEYRKLGEYILTKVRGGEIKNKNIVYDLEGRFQKINEIGNDEDFGTEVTEGVEHALRKEFRETIPTGIYAIDAVTGNGLGRGEFGLIIAPSGIGKTTLLTKIANTAHAQGKNVLQIVFEDTEDQIKRKHYAIWSKIGLQEMDDNAKEVASRVYSKIDKIQGGRLVIKKFSQEDTTIIDVKTWIERYQKKFNFKFDIVILDYLDKLEPHKKYGGDRNEAELAIVKSFEAMASDYKIPCWSAIQANRSGFGAEFVTAHQTGGSIKRVQIAHFVMSIAKTDEQKEVDLANIMIMKARFAKDGHMFKNCVFDNNTLEIRITDEKYLKGLKLKKHNEDDLDKLEEKASLAGMHSKISNYDVKDLTPEMTVETKPVIVGNTEVVERKLPEKSEELGEKDITDKSPIEDKTIKKPENLSFEQKNHVNDLLKQMRENQGDIKKKDKE